jgi:hypothetical protein
VLSMALSLGSLADVFHFRVQHFIEFVKLACWRAGILSGKCLCSNGGSNLASLEFPCATFFASSSVRSLGSKSE